MRKQIVLEIRDRDGISPFDAKTFIESIIETRDYFRYILGELPKDYELRIHSLLEALYPLDWLIEQAVITDTEKGGAA